MVETIATQKTTGDEPRLRLSDGKKITWYDLDNVHLCVL